MRLQAEIPKRLGFLFEPARYKIAYGGRGSAKSWSFARALLVLGLSRPLRILCAREVQRSIKDSVHKLLSDQIQAMGLGQQYEVLETEIRGANGTEVMFAGLATHTVESIKSYEGVDIAWVEEGQKVRKASWDILIPTIRKDGSEIWVSMNPELEDDDSYTRFIKRPPRGAVVRKVNWSDNPWFPAVLKAELEDLKAKDYDSYLHVWEGHCRQSLEGAIYAAELRQALTEGRITRVPYEPGLPVHRFWDLGWADNTSIWMAQFAGMDVRVIDHLSGSRKRISDYLVALQAKDYAYGEDWLPHDGTYGNVASGGRSVSEILRDANCNVHVVPRTKNVVADIDRVRSMFPRLLFDEVKCEAGLKSLRRYCWNTDDTGTTKGREPKHDSSSHDADALRTLCMAIDYVSGDSDAESYDEPRGRSSVSGY